MIPPSWIPHRRRQDDELVGYLVPQGDEVVPVTLFGYPLAEAQQISTAVELLDTVGLSVLADVWQFRSNDGDSIRVRIREVGPDQLVVFPDDFGAGGDLSEAFTLEVPDGGRLSRR